MHALARELERRGHGIACRDPLPTTPQGARARAAAESGDFTVTVAAHPMDLRLTEQGCGARGPWEAHRRWREEDRAAHRFDSWAARSIQA